MKNLLVPTDFSPASRNAARYAAAFAESLGVAVILVNIVAPSVIIDDSVLASVMITQSEILADSREMMQQEIDVLSKEFSVDVTGFVEEGYPSEMILQMAESKNAALMVMGMKGKGRSHSLFGSTTTTIIRKSTYPIFVIPEQAAYSPIANITFASDFDASIEMDRYNLLLAIAEKFNSRINIINVQKNGHSLSQDEVIGKMKTSIAFSKHNHQFQTISEDKVEEGIQKFVEKSPTEILVMVSRKHHFFERMFGTVHTKAMSYQTKIPLLVLQHK
jgi:nucleotide-binding universal stress UspA family protein